jgi:hypothetical protein
MNVFLIPVYLYYGWCALKALDLGWYRHVNPSMPFSGLLVGKKKILDYFDQTFVPMTERFEGLVRETECEGVIKKIQNNFVLPLIVKPDKGARGQLVEKINDWQELENYLEAFEGDLLVQEYVSLPLEFGVFYVRIPGQEFGKITSLMERKFLKIAGDGVSSLEELIRRHDRARFYESDLATRYDMKKVLLAGELKQLGFIGNHCRGTTFADVNNRINSQLNKTFDRLSKQMPDFYYGRYDIRCESFAAMERGDFKIIELNGFFSEPGHVYDPKNKIFRAYRDYLAHYQMMFAVYKNISEKLPSMSLRAQWGILFS